MGSSDSHKEDVSVSLDLGGFRTLWLMVPSLLSFLCLLCPSFVTSPSLDVLRMLVIGCRITQVVKMASQLRFLTSRHLQDPFLSKLCMKRPLKCSCADVLVPSWWHC